MQPYCAPLSGWNFSNVVFLLIRTFAMLPSYNCFISHEEDKTVQERLEKSCQKDGGNKITKTGPPIYTNGEEKQRETKEETHGYLRLILNRFHTTADRPIGLPLIRKRRRAAPDVLGHTFQVEFSTVFPLYAVKSFLVIYKTQHHTHIVFVCFLNQQPEVEDLLHSSQFSHESCLFWSNLTVHE